MKHSPATLYAVRHRLMAEELADLLDTVLAGEVVADRATAERLVRVLGGTLALIERHTVDGRGRCPVCWTAPPRWWRPWPRRSSCSVYVAFRTYRAPDDAHESTE